MAFVQGWVFALASMFAILMYVLGFLLLSIPLPGSRILKDYGRHLIHDSFNLLVTICILNAFLLIALSWQDVVYCSIYGTVADKCGMEGILAFQKSTYELVMAAHQHNIDFVNNIGIGVAAAVTAGQIIVALATINVWGIPLAFYYGARAGAMAATQAASILEPVSSIYGVALISQSFLVYYVEFIYKNWGTLAAFGILLSILPFGIGKRAGFFLVAFPVVSYVMIPLQALLGPIIAENVAGFTAGAGWNIVQSYVSPQVVGLAAIPTMYFTSTAFMLAGLSALTASSIPVAGLTGLAGSDIARHAQRIGMHAAKKTGKIVEKALTTGISYDYYWEGYTEDGEKLKVRAFKRQDGSFGYTPRYIMKNGKVVDVRELIASGRMQLKRSPLPTTKRRQPAAAKVRMVKRDFGPSRQYRQGEKFRVAVGKDATTGAAPTEGEGETSGSKTGSETQASAKAQEAFNMTAGEARYDTNPELRKSWKSHFMEELNEEILRHHWLRAYGHYRTHGVEGLSDQEKAFFRLHGRRYQL